MGRFFLSSLAIRVRTETTVPNVHLRENEPWGLHGDSDTEQDGRNVPNYDWTVWKVTIGPIRAVSIGPMDSSLTTAPQHNGRRHLISGLVQVKTVEIDCLMEHTRRTSALPHSQLVELRNDLLFRLYNSETRPVGSSAPATGRPSLGSRWAAYRNGSKSPGGRCQWSTELGGRSLTPTSTDQAVTGHSRS